MAQFDEGFLPSWKMGERNAKEGRKGDKQKGRREEWDCPCLVTALLRGKSLTSDGPRLT